MSVEVPSFEEQGKKVEVKVAGKTYFIHELDESGLTEWMNSVSARGNKKTGQFDGMLSLLVSKTLRDEAGNSVPQSVVQRWPGSTLNGLFRLARKVNGMDDDEKNS